MSTSPSDGSSSPHPRGFVRRYRFAILAGLAILVAAVGTMAFLAWKSRTRLPGPGDAAYEQYVEAFELGLATLDVDIWDVAEENFNRAVELVPQEPAGWVNRAIVHFRSNRLPEAEHDLNESEKLAPDIPEVQKLRAAIAARGGHFAEAVGFLRKAVEQDPNDVETLYFLARMVKREQSPDSDAEYQRLMEKILALKPSNKHARRELLLIAARRSDHTAVNKVLAELHAEEPSWKNPLSRTFFAELEKAAAGPLGDAIFNSLSSFANVYQAEPGYSRTAEELGGGSDYRGTPIRRFFRLAPPQNTPAPPDMEMTFTSGLLTDVPAGRWDVAVPVWLTGKGNPIVFVANGKELRRVGSPVALPSLPLAPAGLVPIDWNNDFRMDLLIAGPAGLLFYQQGADGAFADVTASTKIPPAVLKGNYDSALAADVDLDGDLDILLARHAGAPVFLRNNFDGSFTPQSIFPEVEAARVFAWADLDHDGAPDAVLLDAQGRINIHANERSGKFRPWPVSPPEGRFLAVTIDDADDNGVLDVVALRVDGVLLRISDRDKRKNWDVAELARWNVPAGAEVGSVKLLSADCDNNGVPDLIASSLAGSAVWLGAGRGKFESLPAAPPPHVVTATSLDETGRLVLLSLDAEGHPVVTKCNSKKDYHWQTVRFRAADGPNEGDNRINSFGIGGEMEFRTGTQVVKRPITAPVVHFGVGTRTRCDVLRITWPNGVPQIEPRQGIDQTIVAQQRLKGSCPFLFTWNGEKFVFVTDFMWSTPLGMYINAQDQGGFLQTSEWVKIRGDQLVPRDGKYEVRINANLWETHYFDHLALRVIDHPVDTEVFADERFMLKPSKPAYQVTGPTRPVAQAWDHHGADVTGIVRAIDGKYLDRAGRGRYQGITNDHWVEVELGNDAPREGPVWLLASGWMHPTDSSVNYAIEQGQHERPHALVMEVPDGKGGWKVAQDKIGFPAGKRKTITLRLDGLNGPGVVRRFRLRTNMEIYWDALHYARGRYDAPRNEKVLLPVVADLHFRGILDMTQADKSSPELPHYDRLVSRKQVWRDLIGYHTRYGDVRELTEKVDDRYVIVTAGDEITLQFEVPPIPSGWKRDFVWVSDGWVKDGDLNTRFGKTVLPLPAHDMPNYIVPPKRLEDDPVFRRYPKDWERFHTRYVTPYNYEQGLRDFKPR